MKKMQKLKWKHDKYWCYSCIG